jgi:hypothetical protein
MPFLDTREHGADFSVIADLQHRMERLLDELDASAPHYAKAMQILEFTGDRRKSAVSDAFVAVRIGSAEISATECEHRARSSAGYKEKMKELMKEQLHAETAKTHHHLLQTRLDVARSQLACERAKIERGL